MRLVTEYLIIVDKEASAALFHLCNNVNEFNKLLQTDPDISIKNNVLTFKQALKLAYEVKTSKIGGKEQRFFHVKVTYDGDEKDMEEYVSLLRSIRSIVHQAGGQPETLWDDVSLFYSQKAYPLIYRIENLMRKLIVYFMLTNVGKEWVAETSPKVVKEAIDKSKRAQYLDVLHQVDFIHLGDFLFKSYQVKDVNDLFAAIAKAQKLDDLKLDELKTFEAKSNWEKYFSKIVDCTDEFLDKRWKQLYELRCEIAHNALFNKSDYDKVVELVGEVEVYLQKAIDNLNKVHVPQEDKEQVAENVASNINTAYGEFIQAWKLFEMALVDAKDNWGLSATLGRTMSSAHILRSLREEEIIDDDFLKEGMELVQFKNQVVHDTRVAFTEQEIRSHISKLEDFTRALKRSWKEEIFNAIKELGDEANLADIYDYIESNSYRRLPSSWKATVRYILQLYSSDTETYKGGDDLFRHVDRGRWGLRNPSNK
jgi:uncharacterized protein YutE (UPF0331/DUF86 family)